MLPPSILEGFKFATFQIPGIPIALLFVPIATYVVLSQWKKLKTTACQEYSKFDTTNIRVTKICIHPIKSCRGISVSEARYTPEGLENDRRWCIVNVANNTVVTARDVAKMVLITPRIIPESSQNEAQLEISFPEDSGCESFSVQLHPTEDTLLGWQSIDVSLWGKNDIEGYVCQVSIGRSPSEILSQYIGFPVLLTMKGPRLRACPPTPRFPDLDAPSYFQDGYPLLVISEESVAAMQERVREMVGNLGVEETWSNDTLEVERFRANVVIKGAGAPFIEDVLTEFTVGSHRKNVDGALPIIQLVRKCARCVLPNVHPETGVRDKAVPLKVLMKHRRGLDPGRPILPCMGCNGIFSGDGVVKVGDWIHMRKMGFV